ncbi:hypothetical protein [Alicyclobacillus acidocaldarius]|uniref:hypothetical protein n=1 Tax=Alicyclobacillus acidocaldarius TaxID=405212 RepID=UPI0002F104D2|nr:hypothetical protein [Alicyclobacillus acidocaldarius]
MAAQATVVKAQSAVLCGPTSAYVASAGQAALGALEREEHLAAQSLASYRNSLMGAQVPGDPPFKAFTSGSIHAWNLDPVLMNHGTLSNDMLWAMTFPYPSGSEAAKERAAIEASLRAMINSPLNVDAIGMIPKSAKAVLAQFHGHPPIALPGFVVRKDAHWPKG